MPEGAAKSKASQVKTGITAIYLVDDLGSTPARVNRMTGEAYINMSKWKDLSPNQRLFILLHEAGHVDQQTTDELKADEYAFRGYTTLGKPLSQSIKALSRVLHFRNPQHYDRLREQTRRAFLYDHFHNGNEKIDLAKMENYLEQGFAEEYSNFDLLAPFSKKGRRKMKAKLAEKVKKDLGIQDTPTAVKPANPAKPATPGPASGSVEGPGPAPAADQGKTLQGSQAKKPNWLLYGGIVFAVILVLFFVIKKRK